MSIALNLAYNKNKLYKTLGYWSRGMLNFNFSEKGLGIVSPSHFVHDFPRKMFLRKVRCLIAFTSQDIGQYVYYNSLRLQSVTSYSLKLTMINLLYPINSFCYMIKKSRQKLKYLEYKKSFWGEIKSIFYHFQMDFSFHK